jgi:phosphohistidine phosphatase SixA
MLRRPFILAGLTLPQALRADEAALPLLRQGGLVVAFRHALAPGTFDPPGFVLGDCKTQRNLNDEGRAQAVRIGRWFSQHKLSPAKVRSSPWCRCVDTAQLAFGRAEIWAALGSPFGVAETVSAEAQTELVRALRTASGQRGRVEVWVTHQFVLSGLVGVAAAAGEGLLLRAGADGSPQLLARLPTF